MNTQLSFIETLKYSKAHDTWATDKEFEHLHRLLPPKIQAVPQAAIKQNTTPPIIKRTGVSGPRTDNKASYENSDQDRQKGLKIMVRELLAKQPNNKFFFSLSKWTYNYTPKQAAAIEAAYKDIIGRVKPEPKEEDNTRWTTDEEENDPNWKPWDD